MRSKTGKELFFSSDFRKQQLLKIKQTLITLYADQMTKRHEYYNNT